MSNLTGHYVDLLNKKIIKAELIIKNGSIEEIVPRETVNEVFILPGFIDSHVHIESSMLTPVEFSKVAVKNGTVAVVSDPHEIANVCGVSGVEYMIENGNRTPMKFYFGAPSCVPATDFESTGHRIDSKMIQEMIQRDDIYFLSEMMNFPGVIYNDNEVHKKIKSALLVKKPIDGHAPGLKGDQLKAYAKSGISTDHECTSIEEAREKIALGMKVLIREGSAAKNFDALFPLIDEYPHMVMLCTDDCHPDNLLNGHINMIVKRAVEKGMDLFNVLMAASLNPKNHYNLNVGMLKKGDPADFIVVDDLKNFNILKTYIDGEIIYDGKNSHIIENNEGLINNFYVNKLREEDIQVTKKSDKINVIEAFDGDLLTKKLVVNACVQNNLIVSDVENDVLKIVVVNRFIEQSPTVGFIKNFGFKQGAIGGSIAHDSHNLIAIGVDDKSILNVIENLQNNKGGIALFDGKELFSLALPIGGLMSSEKAEIVAEKYKLLNDKAQELGSKLNAPFMTMAFMSLLVIPEFKIGDKGLFDGIKFEFDNLFVHE